VEERRPEATTGEGEPKLCHVEVAVH
jgi:hypothetical protein